MGREEDGPRLFGLLDAVPEEAAGGWIEACGGLVEVAHEGVPDHGDGDR